MMGGGGPQGQMGPVMVLSTFKVKIEHSTRCF